MYLKSKFLLILMTGWCIKQPQNINQSLFLFSLSKSRDQHGWVQQKRLNSYDPTN